MQDSAYVDVLKERYRFDEWKDAGRGEAVTEGAEELSFAANEFPGWRLVRQTRRGVNVPGVRSLARTMWQGDGPDRLLGVDVYVCESPAAARETLLRLLGEFQGLQLAPVSGIGDVAFGTPGETAIVFARRHYVAAVRNGGRKVSALGDVARALDGRWLPPERKRTSKPAP